MSTVPKTHSASNPAALLDAALDFAARDMSIIPTIGKRAVGRWKQFQDRPADERTLRRMFARKGITGLAVILGSVSGGLACRDYDDGDAYHRWAADHPDLAETLPTVQTARGYHVYFAGPDGFHDLGDGEYRADVGHYCLLPPSAHPDGPTYIWRTPLPDGELPVVDPVQAGLLPDQTQGGPRHPGRPKTPTTHILMCERGKIPISGVIAETLPTGPGQRFHKIFAFARQLKATAPDADAAKLRPIVRQWFELALPFIRTKEWSVTWEDFIVAWQGVKHPVGGQWSEIVQASKGITVDTGDHDGAAVAIIRLCAALQAHHGDGNSWPLSCRKARDAVGVTHERAARILKMLIFEGMLELVQPAGKKGSGIAATYIFLGRN